MKTDNITSYIANTNNVYTITVANLGPSNALNIVVSDPVPAGIIASTVTWVGSNGSSGTGALNDNLANLAVGQNVSYTVTLPVPAAFNTSISNTVSVSVVRQIQFQLVPTVLILILQNQSILQLIPQNLL